jgi:hypothetical protein
MITLGEFLDEYNTLLPLDINLGALANDDWYIALKPQFDNLVWLYYYDRELLGGRRFPYNDDEKAYNNIIKAFTIYLTQNRRRYERIFNAFMADFNPLWNVDGVMGTVHEATKRGNDEVQNRGDDKVTNSGKDTNTKSGNATHEGSGNDKLIHHYDSYTNRVGNQETEFEGIATDETLKTTFDDSTYNGAEKNTHDMGNRKDTVTYNDVKDIRYGEDYDKNELGSKITDTYNDVKDEFEHGKVETTDYNSNHKTVYNSDDKFVEMVIRQGNIGVTRSDELITHAIELFNSVLYDFFKMVVRDCVNQITYRIY